jgi:hypothetical protein
VTRPAGLAPRHDDLARRARADLRAPHTPAGPVRMATRARRDVQRVTVVTRGSLLRLNPVAQADNSVRTHAPGTPLRQLKRNAHPWDAPPLRVSLPVVRGPLAIAVQAPVGGSWAPIVEVVADENLPLIVLLLPVTAVYTTAKASLREGAQGRPRRPHGAARATTRSATPTAGAGSRCSRSAPRQRRELVLQFQPNVDAATGAIVDADECISASRSTTSGRGIPP